jgi:hypothetical protein
LALKLPRNAAFLDFATGDPGATLHVDALVAQGLIPGLNFGYAYGLLPVLVGRVWFGVLGRTPAAFLGATYVCYLVTGWGLGRYARALDLGTLSRLLLAGGFALQLGEPLATLTHGMEMALVANALAEHAGARRGRALVLIALAALTKPSMAYVYGAVLLMRVARDREWRLLVPGAASWSAVFLLLCGVFGSTASFGALFPVDGRRAYRAYNFGFFQGVGRDFWDPPGARFTYWIGTPAGFYIVASIALVVGAALWTWRRYVSSTSQPEPMSRTGEIVVTCALCHAAFVTFFFAHAWSYQYYLYLLVAGLAALVNSAPRGARPLWIVILLASITGETTTGRATCRAWSETQPHGETFGLWSPAELATEWKVVRRVVSGSRVLLLSTSGGGLSVLDASFEQPRSWMLLKGFEREAMLADLGRSIRGAEYVLVPLGGRNAEPLTRPELASDLASFTPVSRGDAFLLLRRR